jgi:drug/metabolite transporter (DMT)-like permease
MLLVQESRAHREWQGLCFGTIGMLAFSGTVPATRIAVPALGPAILTFGRIEVAALLGLITLLLTRSSFPARRHWPGLLCMGSGLAIGYPLFIALALREVPAVHGAVIIGLAPGATAALALWRAGERPPRRFWIACATGLLAIAVFALVESGGAVSAADGWLALAILSVAVAYVEGGRVSRALGGIARVGQLNLLQPLAALLWSAWLLGEPISFTAASCAAVVVAAMLVCIRSRIRRPAG